MTTTIYYRVVCTCGHVGKIRMKENDQPFSSAWESYSLDGLDGTRYTVDGYAHLEEVFRNMKPSCPSCKRMLSLDDVQDG